MRLICVKCRYDKNPFSIVKVCNLPCLIALIGDGALLVRDYTLYILVAAPLDLAPPSLIAATKWPPFPTVQGET
jgi:hypothetical protein